MELKEAIAARKSIRAFLPEPVPRQTLETIMERALRAPSWGNTQPWGFTVIGGATLKAITEDYIKLFREQAAPRPELEMPAKFSEAQTTRYRDLGRDLLTALGIGREDREKRQAYTQEMTRFFGAPCVIYLHLERGFNQYALLDCGLILQSIALLAVDEGLGTCFLARSVQYPDVIRRHAPIPEDRVLVVGTAVGYPVPGHPANTFRSRRAGLGEIVQWVDI